VQTKTAALLFWKAAARFLLECLVDAGARSDTGSCADGRAIAFRAGIDIGVRCGVLGVAVTLACAGGFSFAAASRSDVGSSSPGAGFSGNVIRCRRSGYRCVHGNLVLDSESLAADDYGSTVYSLPLKDIPGLKLMFKGLHFLSQA
jgi:hypothetical protein